MRDGDRCVYCGVRFGIGTRAPTIDHQLPESRGGAHRLANTVLCCAGCNRRKGTMTRAQFEASKILFRRRCVVMGEELKAIRRATTYSHAALVFGVGGTWLCPRCGCEGTRDRSPTFVPCVTVDLTMERSG